MVKKYSIAEARDNLAGVVQEAEEGTQVELTRQGKPVALLVGVEEFERPCRRRSLASGRPTRNSGAGMTSQRSIPTRFSVMCGIHLPAETSTGKPAFLLYRFQYG